jgi:hypothetical protein
MNDVRTRIAVIKNTLDVISISGKLMQEEHLAHKKLKYQTPLRLLLFALLARCDRLFEESIYYTEQVSSGRTSTCFFELTEFLISKRKQLKYAQNLLQQDRICASIRELRTLAEEMAGFEVTPHK